MAVRTIKNCSLIRKMGGGKPNSDNGKCVGFTKSETDDEPCEICKECRLNSTFEPLKPAEPVLCTCGSKPKFERVCGWWHIECPKCGNTPREKMGCTTIYGYNTRREAVDAWNRLINK